MATQALWTAAPAGPCHQLTLTTNAIKSIGYWLMKSMNQARDHTGERGDNGACPREFLALAPDDSHARDSNPTASPRGSTPSTDQRPGEMSSAAATDSILPGGSWRLLGIRINLGLMGQGGGEGGDQAFIPQRGWRGRLRAAESSLVGRRKKICGKNPCWL